MTDTLLEQIKADRENDKEKEKGWMAGPILWDEDTGDAAYTICDRKHASASVYNRIERIPDLEDAYIALTEARARDAETIKAAEGLAENFHAYACLEEEAADAGDAGNQDAANILYGEALKAWERAEAALTAFRTAQEKN